MVPSSLSSRTTVAYAAAVGPVAILSLPFSVFLPPFITEGGVIAVGLVGIIFAIATVWDGVVDPTIGNMIDRVSRGPRPHFRWIGLASPPILVLLAILAFWGDTLSLVPLLLVLVLFTSSLSLFDVAHLAWGSALAEDKAQSSRLFGAREWSGKIFVLLAFAAPAIVQLWQPDLKIDGQILAYAALAALALPISLWSATRLPARPIMPQPAFNLRAEVATILGFRPLKLLILAQALNTFGLGAMTSLFVFYASGVLGLESQGPVLLLISFVGGILMTPVWIKIALRLGKPIGMMIMSLWLVAVLQASFFLPKGEFAAAALFVFALGSGFAGLIFIYGMTSDLVSAHKQESGRDRTGLLFSLTNVTQKVGTAAGIGVSYVALDILGFDAGNPASSAETLRLLYAGLPTLGWSAVAVVMFTLSRERALRADTVSPIEAASKS